ncbi:MAG: hypothetical protein AB7F86_19095 [Bdellovibrionales bacterium]
MKYWLITLLLTFQAQADNLCTRPRMGQCDFYPQCLESAYKCGPDGYPMGYGAKYCARFNGLTSAELSPKGLVWRDYTLVCLQQSLVSLMITTNPVNTCSQLKDFAFRTHVSCYTQPIAPVCNLTLGDWMTIASVVDLKEYADRAGLEQVVQVIRQCGDSVKQQLADLLKKLKLPISAHESDLLNAQMPPNMSEEEFTHTLKEIYELREKLQFIEGGIEI